MSEHDVFCLVWLYDPEQRRNPAFRKIFYKKPIDIKRNTFKHWRRYVADAIASKAKSHLQESMMALEAKSGTMQVANANMKNLKNQLYQQRSTISALEKQKVEMGEMMVSLERKKRGPKTRNERPETTVESLEIRDDEIHQSRREEVLICFQNFFTHTQI